jgi:hypothetical protein
MPWKDCKQIMKGILILFICIMLGVMAAEKQLNNLTEYHDFVQACNIQGNVNQGYSVYFLGYRYTLPYTGDFTQYIKKGYELSGAANTWVTALREAGVKKAYHFKKWFEEAWQEALYEMESY